MVGAAPFVARALAGRLSSGCGYAGGASCDGAADRCSDGRSGDSLPFAHGYGDPASYCNLASACGNGDGRSVGHGDVDADP